MGRGTYEHNYTNLDLAELATEAVDAAPMPVSIPRDLFGTGPVTADAYCADNHALIHHMADSWYGAFHLIYLDPPFGTGKRYAARVNGVPGQHSREVTAYQDSSDFDVYLRWLTCRLALMRDLLTPSGTLYVHLDWHAVHYVKVALDGIFGRERFLNEIIWCYHGPSPIKSAFNRKHDTILAYTRSPAYYFDADSVRVPYDKSTFKAFASSPKAGFGKVPNLERGKVPEDWWYFPVVARLHSERVGYQTQKPLALLERIVLASSRPGDLVGDFFAGSGTSGVAATRAGRNAIMVDRNPIAIEKCMVRLAREHPGPHVRVWRYFTPEG